MRAYLTLLFFIASITHTNAQEVIPFTLGDDNRIYIKGTINQSDTLNLVFDLGANITVINTTRVKQSTVTFDSLVSNRGINGTKEEKISLNNVVTIGNQTYKNVKLLGISYTQEEVLDGIIGWNFFSNKIIKINYEQSTLTLYNEQYKIPNSYSKSKIKYINNLPFIKVSVYNKKTKLSLLAMLDIGYNDVLLIKHKTVADNNLLDKFPIIGAATTRGTGGAISKSKRALLPRFDINGFQIYNMPAHLTQTPDNAPYEALLGAALLKRFHIILDLNKNKAYLKPNIHINSEFDF